MHTTIRLIFFLLLALLAAACVPFTIPMVAAPVVTVQVTEVSPIAGTAQVDSVQIQIIEDSPLQAHALVRGNLPDSGCTRIASVDQVRDGDTFRLSITTTTDPLALCAQALTPFEQRVALDVASLPPARYRVVANGVERSFELLSRDSSRFQQQLVEALNARNFDLLRLLMDESFVIGHWRSEANIYNIDQAIEQLRQNYLGDSASIRAESGKDLNALLDGMDPLAIAGLDAASGHALFISGWGMAGKDEAILYVAVHNDGSLYWHSVLSAGEGFAPPDNSNNPPENPPVFATDVQLVMAQRDVSIHARPDSSSEVIGSVFSGQIAKVTGANENGTWWRVVCPDDTIGSCWVSADPALTRPTAPPASTQPAPPSNRIPTITIEAVARNDRVTIQTHNYPANTEFVVRMGKIGTRGVNGIWAGTLHSGKGGSITATFDIPPALHGDRQISIRLESKSGYYSYNWFYNDTSGSTPTKTPDPGQVKSTDVKFILAHVNVFIRSGPGKQYDPVGAIAEGQIAKVTGISLDSNWWRVICPDDTIGSCWVTAGSTYTQPTDPPGNNPPVVQPTDVGYVMAQRDVSIYTGPGTNYTIIGLVAEGQIAKVTGTNADQTWWRVICPDDTIGSCWVSANSADTLPTQPPG